jgi:hypothetical protein
VGLKYDVYLRLVNMLGPRDPSKYVKVSALISCAGNISNWFNKLMFSHFSKSFIKMFNSFTNAVNGIIVRNSKCREILRLDNKKSINIEIIEGPIRERKLLLSRLLKITPRELT